MKVLFIGIFCEKRIEELIQSKTNKFPYAQHKFEKMIIDGFIHNQCDFNVLSTIPVNRWPSYKQILINYKSDDERYKYLKFINLPIIKQISIIISYLISIIKWAFRNKDEKKIVLIYGTNPLNSIIFFCLRKILHIKIIVIVSEINDYSYFNTKSFIKLLKKKLYLTTMHCLQNSYDGYILLSKNMNNVINLKKRPSLVIETMSIPNKESIIPYSLREKKIVYAGGLYRKYGIEKLIKSFILLNNNDFTLELYGAGDYVEEIIAFCKEYKNIYYGGTISNEKVLMIERKAYLLLNPRPSSEIITKYSFPSKTAEYFSSGTACLITRLEGIPEDYYNYCFTFNDESIEGVALKLKEVLDLDSKIMEKMAYTAQKYIMDKKNYIIQTKKIIIFLENI